MAKFANDDVMDAMLDEIALATTLTVCSSQPTDHTEATSTYKLADVTLTPGAGNGDFTIANGDISGRKLTVAEQADIPIDATGEPTHIALCDSTRLLYVTTCSPQGEGESLVSGNTVTVPAWDIEVADPS